MRPNVELEIGELILRGLPHAQRRQIAAAVEQELLRLLAERGLPPSLAEGGRIPQIAVGDLRFEPGAKPGAIGGQIAARVYDGMAGVRTTGQSTETTHGTSK